MATIIFKHITDIEFKDYDVASGNTTFTAEIKTYDATSLTNTGLVLLDGDNTLIEATFTGDYLSDPDYPFSMYGILELDVRGIGGDTFIKQISTVYDSTNFTNATDEVWSGSVPINKASLTLNPTNVVLEAELDYTKLDFTINEYKLTARLGKYPELETFCLITEDSDNIMVEDLSGCVTTE